MKLIHLSDLHLGKRVNGFSMLEDQAYIIEEILRIVGEERPEAVLLAGDVYDKPVPPVEAVRLFDRFLWELCRQGREVFVISGNHDSAERVAFASRLLDRSGVHIAPAYDGKTLPVTLRDDYGEVNIYLLPFVKPVQVRDFFAEEQPESYTDALRAVTARMQVDPSVRNVLVTHQFVTGALRSESEEISVGGADNVDASVFDMFDYVALGHLHGPQSVGRETLRYCGTPLKYSLSEKDHVKSVTVAELRGKGDITVRTRPLQALRDLRAIRGSYLELTSRETWQGTAVEDYLYVTLTDEEDVPDAIGRLRAIYPNIMKLEYDNTRTRSAARRPEIMEIRKQTPYELFAGLYERQNGKPMSRQQEDFVRGLMEEIWEDER